MITINLYLSPYFICNIVKVKISSVPDYFSHSPLFLTNLRQTCPYVFGETHPNLSAHLGNLICKNPSKPTQIPQHPLREKKRPFLEQ